ncbi:MAG: enoyl-CoA hydratase [Alphaproteobacteria bacterium]|nr:enoyl-CoA hydratase [Alphaproteobacteria bacterium]
MAYDTITYETKGPVALLKLNRPDRLNAWTPHMSEEQADAINRANADKAIGAIVMTGAGRGFCAGADMEATFKSRLDGVDPGNDTGNSGGMPGGLDWIGLCRKSKPLIAAVNGPAVGIGVTMILPFDVIIASDAARFGLVFVKVGIVPELASSHFLVSRMGWGRASELMLSARIIGGAEAYERGLADMLAPADALMDKAFEVGNQIAANPDPMLRMTKDLLTQNACEQDLALAQRRENDYLKACWPTPEHKEAVSAFLDKRPARFR